MTLNITRWSPDTCECVIDYEWDTDVSEEQRIHTAKTIVKKCDAHSTSDILDKHDHFNTILGENRRKNGLHNEVLDQLPHITDVIDNRTGTILAGIQPSESAGRRLKPHINYKFEFKGTGKDRILHVEFENAVLSSKHKKKIKDIADSMFGNDKVVVK